LSAAQRSATPLLGVSEKLLGRGERKGVHGQVKRKTRGGVFDCSDWEGTATGLGRKSDLA